VRVYGTSGATINPLIVRPMATPDLELQGDNFKESKTPRSDNRATTERNADWTSPHLGYDGCEGTVVPET
jgi:hypothetical protein